MDEPSHPAAALPAALWQASPWGEAAAYMVDSWQRGLLFLDVLRQRGNQYHEHMAQAAPNVLHFDGEVLIDGRHFDRPVNYGLVRITPPEGVRIDPLKRPFIVFDPRAGHGPGIGGFKADSELGVAMRAGHPAYFVGFLPHPEPGQTVEDVVRAEIRFVEHVGRLHGGADGLPVVIGNCQAGWQVMMAAALRPDLFGPIILAGTPLSYWAGRRGGSPMRYSGGLLGGSWLTALAGDLGHGLFDGAWLVQNFEAMNPANTLWSKPYNLYAKIDTEAPRYLEFERWWGGHVLLNAGEMQDIVDQLFIGNRLATAEIVTSDGQRIDFRNIRSPIIVFCSHGDEITPPEQALGWITDLYGSEDEFRANGQTIVYAVHDSIGHLGIFVSAKVARMEHQQFANNIDLIDVLPPGLYEAELRELGPAEANSELVDTGHISRFTARGLEDIRAIVGGDVEEERRFATVARLSKVNLGLYRMGLQPLVRQAVSEATAEWLRRVHPLRLGYEFFSDHNPLLHGIPALAALARQTRQPAAPDNLFRRLEEAGSRAIVAGLDQGRDLVNAAAEQTFHTLYGLPLLQALLGVAGEDGPLRRHPGQEWDQKERVQQEIDGLRARIGEGGLGKAALRALIHVGVAERAADQRAFALLRRMRDEHGAGVTLRDFKLALREQFLTLRIDQEAALAALPGMLAGADGAAIEDMLQRLHRVQTAVGPLSGEAEIRWRDIEAIFRAAAGQAPRAAPASPATPSPAPTAPAEPPASSGPAPSAAPEKDPVSPPAELPPASPPTPRPSRRRRREPWH